VKHGIFDIAWLVLFVLWCAARALGTEGRRRSGEVKEARPSSLDAVLLALVSVGMLVAPFVYLFSPWLDFAAYSRPAWLGWIGVAVAFVATWLLWRSHTDLGRHWAPLVEIRKDHALVTRGVYARMRHPMYAAHGLWAVAQVLLLPNWAAGPALLVPFIPFYLSRVGREERMLAEHFGDEWRAYAARTARLLPRLRGRD
jgi:protein-S-isoprenylcysteine O-methyltransferase Ste14